MHLDLHHRDPVPECYGNDPEVCSRYYPAHHSRLVDDAMARAEIMREFLRAGFKGYHVIKDNYSPFETLSERTLRTIEHASAGNP